MNDYEARLEAKRARAEELAAKAQARSDAAEKAARTTMDGIPLGQPILVGHHSEKRHRRDIARIDNNLRKASEEAKKAEYYRRKAENVGEQGISSEDPDALQKLEEKKRGLETRREGIKAVNAAWRRAKKPNWDDAAAWVEIAEGLSDEIKPLVVEGLETCQVWRIPGQPPFPSYSLSNLSANIRTVSKRIEELARLDVRPCNVEFGAGPGWKVYADDSESRVCVEFDTRQPKEVIQERLRGWKWSRRFSRWQRQDTANGIAAARALVAWFTAHPLGT